MPGKDVPGIFKEMKTEYPGKPVLAVSPLGDREIFLKMHRGFQSLGIPSYTSDEEAVVALAALNRYRDSRDTAS
jgi:acyl-CoA synthetase (NDP forming)